MALASASVIGCGICTRSSAMWFALSVRIGRSLYYSPKNNSRCRWGCRSATCSRRGTAAFPCASLWRETALDERLHLRVDRRILVQRAVGHTGGQLVQLSAVEDRTVVRVDHLVTRAAPGRVADGERGFVSRVQVVQERRVGPHLDTRCVEANVGGRRAVIRSTEPRERVDLGRSAEAVDVVTNGDR